MSTQTARLSLPLLQTAQAQKDVTHNEALASIDMLVQAVVDDVPLNTPPASPVDGSAYIVGGAPMGDWAAHADNLAFRINSAWVFQAPFDGLRVWLKSFGKTISYSANAWRIGELNASYLNIDGVTVVRGQQPAIADPSGGATIDAEARSSVNAVLTALRAHGLIAT